MLNLLTAMCDPCHMDNCITCTTFANDYSSPVCVEAGVRAGLGQGFMSQVRLAMQWVPASCSWTIALALQRSGMI